MVQVSTIKCSDWFQLRWLKNNLIEIGKTTSNQSIFNHLKCHLNLYDLKLKFVPSATTSTAIVSNVTDVSSVTNSSMISNSTGPDGRAMIDVTYEVLEDGPVCGRYKYGVRLFLACWPALIRFLQCIRRYYDSRKAFPHLYNAGKYSTTFFKVRTITYQQNYV